VTIFDPVQDQFILLEPRQKQATVRKMGSISGVAAIRPGTAGNLTAPPPPPVAGTPVDPGVLLESLRNMKQSQMNTSTARAMRPTREALGTSEMEGFTVTGTRISITIPAGERGNDKPMTTTSERWFSPDLQMELLTKSESPETGQHTHKLVNIRTGDPDPALFQVPADYTVREQPQR
jgi:hypothetical protein